MDLIKAHYLKENYKSLGYAVVKQAFDDYKRNLRFIKNEYKHFKKIFIFKENLVDSFKTKVKETLKEMKEIKKFIISDWYAILCPIVHKRIALEQLEKFEKEILGEYTYLLD